MTINITDTFAPSSGDNTFPVVVDTNVKNGYRVKANIAARNATDTRLLTAGALIGVLDSDGSGTFAVYRYLGGSPAVNSNWLVQSPESTIVWRPNGTGDATTFADVMTLMRQRLGAVVIQCDQSPGTYTIPAGTYVLNQGSYFFNPVTTTIGINCDDGVQLKDLAGLDGVSIDANNTAIEFFDFTIPQVEFFIRNNGQFGNDGDVVAYTLQSNATLYLDNDGGIATSSAGMFDINGLELSVISTRMLAAGFESTAFIDGGGTGTLSLVHDGSGFPWPYTSTVNTYINSPTSQDGGYGPTSFRPSNVAANERTNYWDTDVGVPIVWDGTEWITEIPQIVWRAGGGGTATTFAQVMAQVALAVGPSIIYGDDGSYTIPAGTYEMKFSSFVSKTNGGNSAENSISCDDGVILNNLAVLDGFLFQGNNSSGQLLTYDDEVILAIKNGGALDNVGGAEPAIQVSDADVTIYLQNAAALGENSVGMLAGGTVTIVVSNPVNQSSSMTNGSVVGAFPARIFLYHDGVIMPNLPGFTGSFENSNVTLVGGSGPTAKRPQVPVKGCSYYDTDTVQYLIWDGATWKVVTLV